MAKYKLQWEEVSLWESEVEAENQVDAKSKVMNDEVQEKAEVSRTYDMRKVKAWRDK